MILLNWGEKSKKICNASIDFCSNCNKINAFNIYQTKKTVGAFFISLKSWEEKYYLVCENCTAGFPINDNKIDIALRGYTEAPSLELSLEIFKELEKLFISENYLSSDEKLKKFSDDAIKILNKNGYNEKDIIFIIPALLKLLNFGMKK